MSESAPDRIAFFDTLRCWAIVPVVATHFYSPAAPGGHLGVFLFFAISGYLIAMTLGRNDVRSFYLKRLFRIYVPLLAVLMLWALASSETRDGAETIRLLYENAFVLRPTGTAGYAIGVLWTLHAEIWFYIFAPLLLLPVIGRWAHGRLVATGLLLAVSGIALASRAGLVAIPVFPLRTMIIHLDCFAVGMLVYLWRDRLIISALASRITIAVAFCCLLVLYFAPPKGTPFHAYAQLGVALLGCAIVAACLRGTVRLNNPLTVFIGRISYSIYLVHGLILDFRWTIPLRNGLAALGFYQLLGLSPRLDLWPNRILLFVAMLLVVSWLVHLTAEKAGIRIGRRLAECLASKRGDADIAGSGERSNVAAVEVRGGGAA